MQVSLGNGSILQLEDFESITIAPLSTARNSPAKKPGTAGLSVFPKCLEPIGCQSGVSRRVLNVPVAEVSLQGAGIDAVIG